MEEKKKKRVGSGSVEEVIYGVRVARSCFVSLLNRVPGRPAESGEMQANP
jgi:hypothetical protein